MEYTLYALKKEPFTGAFPEDISGWLQGNRSDHLLAEAYAVIESHCSTLSIFLSGDDPWGEQALADWQEVLHELTNVIIGRMKNQGLPSPDKKGNHYAVTPFMEALGYEECAGEWHRK